MKTLWLGLLLGLLGCASNPDPSATVVVTDLDEPSYDQFVQPVLERHCGSLDCHGKLPRGLQIYGMDGLRLPNDAGLAVGTGPTSDEEKRATYLSVMGLQPELMNAFLQKSPRTSDDAYGLLLLSKPLAIERHRPGASLRKGEPAERCITSWLIGAVDQPSCAAALP